MRGDYITLSMKNNFPHRKGTLKQSADSDSYFLLCGEKSKEIWTTCHGDMSLDVVIWVQIF